ncbi:MAG: hypothetical protein AMXMBFR33_37740 [Candidatus Xenobia bacterium]
MTRLFLLLLLALPGLAQGQAASLEITTDPPGALVVLDRRVLGHTPLRIDPLRPGLHHLRLSAGEDYRPHIIEEYEALPGDRAHLDIRLQPSTRLLLENGRQAVLEGRYRAALPLLEEAASGLPRQPEALWWIGQLRLMWGELEASLEAMRDYADYAPYRSDLYLFLGLIHEAQNRPAEAVTAYKLALTKTETLKNALDGLSSNPTWDEIKALGDPQDARGRLRKAQLLSLKGQMEPALAELKQAVSQVFGDWRQNVPRQQFEPL